MEKELKKKKWAKPKLIVLIRGKHEEWVLATCKVGFGSPGGSSWFQSACYLSSCFECITRTAT